MSEEERESRQETAHLLRSPRNAERLLQSIAQADAEQVMERDLLTP